MITENRLTDRHQLEPAIIEWKNDHPYSTVFQDIYYGSDDRQIIDEITHVFIEPNNLIERLTEQRNKYLANQKNMMCTIHIGELGFGTGLNLFVLLHHLLKIWTNNPFTKASTCLHFVSFEKHPICQEDRRRLSKLHTRWFPELQATIQKLLKLNPPNVSGIHRLYLPEVATQLTLVYGDIQDSITQLFPKMGSIDAWFLDGFSPAKNPEMWQQPVLNNIAKLSRIGTSFSTFTAAAKVKQGLSSAGFFVEKINGFGRKRDMLKGVLYRERIEEGDYIFPDNNGEIGFSDQRCSSSSNTFTAKERPWFLHASRTKVSSDVAIIGGGLSGTACAYSLAKRGLQVTLIERNPKPAQEASGNPMAVTFVKFTPHNTPQNRFYQFAYIDAVRHLHEISSLYDKPIWHQSGVVQLAYNEKELAYQRTLIESGTWPDSLVRFLDAKSIQLICETTINSAGLWLPSGGWAQPSLLCNTRLEHPNISLKMHSEALALKHHTSGSWEVITDSGKCIAKAGAVIIANAIDSLKLKQTAGLPLDTVRGQISQISATESSKKLKPVICYDGYIGPALNGEHTIGATFQPKSRDANLSSFDHRENLTKFNQALPDIAQQLGIDAILDKQVSRLKGRVGFRCKTPDYLPIVGPIPNDNMFSEAYLPISHGSKFFRFPKGGYLPNLYISVGHGSRGLTTSNISAELLTSYITRETPILDREVINAIHPCRFIMRKIKRKQ